MTDPHPEAQQPSPVGPDAPRRVGPAAIVGTALVLVVLAGGALAASVRTFAPRAVDMPIDDALTTDVRWDGTARCVGGDLGVSLVTRFTDEPDTRGAPMSVQVTFFETPPDRSGGLATGAESGRTETTAILEDTVITLDPPDDPGDLGVTGGALRVTTDPDGPDSLAGELQTTSCRSAELVQAG